MDPEVVGKEDTFLKLDKNQRFALVRNALDLSFDRTRESRVYGMLDRGHNPPAEFLPIAGIASNRDALQKSMQERKIEKEEIQKALQHASTIALRMVIPEGQVSKVRGFVKADSQQIFDLIDALTRLSGDPSYKEFDFVAQERDRELEEALLSSLEDAILPYRTVFRELPPELQEAFVNMFTHSAITTTEVVQKINTEKEETDNM